MADDTPSTPSRREQASVGEVVDYVKTYAKQETLDPLTRAGKFVGFGAAGALLAGLGVSILILGVLRLLQSEWTRSASGRLSWLAYVIALLAGLAMFGVVIWVAARQINRTIIGKESTR